MVTITNNNIDRTFSINNKDINSSSKVMIINNKMTSNIIRNNMVMIITLRNRIKILSPNSRPTLPSLTRETHMNPSIPAPEPVWLMSIIILEPEPDQDQTLGFLPTPSLGDLNTRLLQSLFMVRREGSKITNILASYTFFGDEFSFYTLTNFVVNNYGKSDHSDPDQEHYQYQPPPPGGSQEYEENSLDRDYQDKEAEITEETDDTFVDGDHFHVEVGYHGLEALDAAFHGDGDQFGVPGDEAGEFGFVFLARSQLGLTTQFSLSRFYFDRKYSLPDESPPGFEDNNIVVTDHHDGGEIISEESYLPDIEVYPYHTDRSELKIFANSTISHFRQENLLQYDHGENDKLELLSNTDSEDIFTFNANEIYISEPHDPQDRGFEENFGFEEDNASYDYEGFGADDLFFPQKASNRFYNYEEVCYYRDMFMSMLLQCRTSITSMNLSHLTIKNKTRRDKRVIRDRVLILREATMEDRARDDFIRSRVGGFLTSLPRTRGKPLQLHLNLGSNNDNYDIMFNCCIFRINTVIPLNIKLSNKVVTLKGVAPYVCLYTPHPLSEQ